MSFKTDTIKKLFPGSDEASKGKRFLAMQTPELTAAIVSCFPAKRNKNHFNEVVALINERYAAGERGHTGHGSGSCEANNRHKRAANRAFTILKEKIREEGEQ